MLNNNEPIIKLSNINNYKCQIINENSNKYSIIEPLAIARNANELKNNFNQIRNAENEDKAYYLIKKLLVQGFELEQLFAYDKRNRKIQVNYRSINTEYIRKVIVHGDQLKYGTTTETTLLDKYTALLNVIANANEVTNKAQHKENFKPVDILPKETKKRKKWERTKDEGEIKLQIMNVNSFNGQKMYLLKEILDKTEITIISEAFADNDTKSQMNLLGINQEIIYYKEDLTYTKSLYINSKKRIKNRNVAILINKRYIAKEIYKEYWCHNIIAIKIEGIELIVVAIYIAPSKHNEIFARTLSLLEEIFNENTEQNQRMVIGGDWNININDNKELKKLIDELKFTRLVIGRGTTNRTFKRGNNGGLLDYIATAENTIIKIEEEDSEHLDHLIIRYQLKFEKEEIKKKPQLQLPNMNKLQQRATEITVQIFEHIEEPRLKEMMLKEMVRMWTKEHPKMVTMEQAKHKTYSNILNDIDIKCEEWKTEGKVDKEKLENIIKNLRKNQCKDFLLNAIKNKNVNGKSKEFWKTIKTLVTKKNNKIMNDVIFREGKLLDGRVEAEEGLLTEFNKMFGSYEANLTKDTVKNLKKYKVTKQEVKNALGKINLKKSMAWDGFPSKTIEMIRTYEAMGHNCDAVYEIIAETINNIIEGEDIEVPIARLIAINKGSSNTPSVEEARPIVVASLLMKILEMTLTEKLKPLIEGHSRQFGFTKGRSTLLLLDWIAKKYEDLKQRRKQNKKAELVLIFFDFKNAFPSVRHESIFDEIYEIGKDKMENEMLEEIVNSFKWLYNMQPMSMSVGGKKIFQRTGTAQGGLSSPLLFNLCMDKILTQLEEEIDEDQIGAFADDLITSLEMWDKNKIEAIIKKVTSAAKPYGLEINLKKCGIIRVNRRYKDQEIKGVKLVKEYKYLGITVNYKGNIESHLKIMTEKITTITNEMYKLYGNGVPLSIREDVWKTLINSKIEYGIGPFLRNENTLTRKYEHLHRISIKMSLGVHKLANPHKMMTILAIPDVVTRSLERVYKARAKDDRRMEIDENEDIAGKRTNGNNHGMEKKIQRMFKEEYKLTLRIDYETYKKSWRKMGLNAKTFLNYYLNVGFWRTHGNVCCNKKISKKHVFEECERRGNWRNNAQRRIEICLKSKNKFIGKIKKMDLTNGMINNAKRKLREIETANLVEQIDIVGILGLAYDYNPFKMIVVNTIKRLYQDVNKERWGHQQLDN
jgi:Reverse transcriptase (RNA-dependent DNA polymerase)